MHLTWCDTTDSQTCQANQFLSPVPDVAGWLELIGAASRGSADGSHSSSSARAFPIAKTSGDCGNAWTTDTQACHSVMTYDMEEAVYFTSVFTNKVL